MKKRIARYAFISTFMFALIFTNNIEAACKDQGQNFSEGQTKQVYNCETGELKLYGMNKFGELGSGDYEVYSKNGMIDINEKVGNKKIIDYLITEKTTHVLTEDGIVYGTGQNIGNGAKGKRNTFTKIKFYKESSNKITTINGRAVDKEFNDEIEYKTMNKNINYYHFRSEPISLDVPLTSGKSSKCGSYEYLYTSEQLIGENASNLYPVYKENKNKIEYYVQINSNNKLVFKMEYKDKNTHKIYNYKNGVIHRFESHSSKADSYKTYKNGVITKYVITTYKSKKGVYEEDREYVKTYKNGKVVNFKRYKSVYYKEDDMSWLEMYSNETYTRSKSGKVTKYVRKTYNSNGRKISEKVVKYKNNNKLDKKLTKTKYKKNKLYSKIYYKYNSKGKLASNKYGKATKKTVYYKSGKKIKTVNQKYNAKGKLAK